MAITRQAKEQAVEQLTTQLSQLKLAVLADYRGLSVAEVEELRAQLRAENVSLRVTKNTLMRLAAKNSDNFKDIDPAIFTGPLALALSTEDEVAPARVIFQYAKDHEALDIVGALTAEGEVLTPAEVKALATLPTRDQLLAQVVGTIAAPLSGLVGVMGSNVRSIVTVINAIQKAKE